jgi:hypothetical protein
MTDRPIATDALTTLGTILDDTAKRDAIHLAVIPVIAGEEMDAGQHVTVRDGAAWATSVGEGVGIVDPFLTTELMPGERFWLVLYPRTIQSLRHVWSHPEFPDEPTAGASGPDRRAESEKWLRSFIDTADCPSYEMVMATIADGYETWDPDHLHFDGRDAHGEIPPEFWDHVEIVLGRSVRDRPKYFSCSC